MKGICDTYNSTPASDRGRTRISGSAGMDRGDGIEMLLLTSGGAGVAVRSQAELGNEKAKSIEGRVTCVTRPSTVDKPNREARSRRPTQAPPLMNAICFACKGCYITSRKGYSTSGPGKVTIHRPGLSPLPPMNVGRLIPFAQIVSRPIRRILRGFPH
ncbi:MAG: hypothetical protein QM703_10405 [Gemmatales bacterium]